MASVNFFSQGVVFKLKNPRKVTKWIKTTVEKEKQSVLELNFIFCSDKTLLKINRDYLHHNTLTDIITFDNRDDLGGALEGDVFISLDRIKENALAFGVPFDDELHRVIIHGVLHLLGYSDKDKRQKNQMRKKEDVYLSLRK